MDKGRYLGAVTLAAFAMTAAAPAAWAAGPDSNIEWNGVSHVW